jgi:hypothetical protein
MISFFDMISFFTILLLRFACSPFQTVFPTSTTVIYIFIAKSFLESHKAEFQDQFQPDMQQLVNILEPQHVRENQLATLFRDNKYMVLMSSYAFELLISFLQDSKFITMLKYINQYINIKGLS